jgi:hypothetical protein
LTKVHPFGGSGSVNTMSTSWDIADVESQSVEEFLVERLEPVFLDSSVEDLRVGVHAASDTGETLWTVVNGIHRSHICEQRLAGADVTRGFLSANMLFAS